MFALLILALLANVQATQAAAVQQVVGTLLCRGGITPTSRTYVELEEDCDQLLGEWLNPLTGTFVSKPGRSASRIIARYKKAGCPFSENTPEAALRRAFLLSWYHLGAQPGGAERLQQAFPDIPAQEQQTTLPQMARFMPRGIGMNKAGVVNEANEVKNSNCYVMEECDITDACSRSVVAAMSFDPATGQHGALGAAALTKKHNKQLQQSFAATLSRVHKDLQVATQTCDVDDPASIDPAAPPLRQTGGDGDAKAVKKPPLLFDCWPFAKKFKWTAKRLCEDRTFWETNKCGGADGTADCSKLCHASSTKRTHAPTHRDTGLCTMLSDMHRCQAVKAAANEAFLADSCALRSEVTRTRVADWPNSGIPFVLGNLLAFGSKGDKETLVETWCRNLLTPAQQRDVAESLEQLGRRLVTSADQQTRDAIEAAVKALPPYSRLVFWKPGKMTHKFDALAPQAAQNN